jgi:U3 small nucleolar RNA-associated protein 22
MESLSDLKARVVVCDGTQDSEIIDKACLEIVTLEGWAFSARIWHDREATLFDRIINDKKNAMSHIAMTKGKDYSEGLLAKELYIRRFIHAPRHHRAIAALCHRYTAFSGTVRLVKHWLLHGHIAVEIICAHFFVGDGGKLMINADSEQAASHPVPAGIVKNVALQLLFSS